LYTCAAAAVCCRLCDACIVPCCWAGVCHRSNPCAHRSHAPAQSRAAPSP
jgi:hypothetical protein